MAKKLSNDAELPDRTTRQGTREFMRSLAYTGILGRSEGETSWESPYKLSF
jgi:hypothetical protein